MTARRRPTKATELRPPDPRYVEFASAFKNHPALQCETIYALPNALIDAIKKEIPDFFLPDQEVFERELARLSDGGFFLQRPIAHPLLPGSEIAAAEASKWEELERRHDRTDQAIREMLVGELETDGRSQSEIDQWFVETAEYRRRAVERQLGYLGWLVTEPVFRRSRDEFLAACGADVRRTGAFPKVPVSIFGETPGATPEGERSFREDYMQFFRHWSLQSMATWELPIPLRPEMMGPSLYHLPSIREAGVVLFVPWYLLRDKDVRLREAAVHQQFLHGPPQLAGWFKGEPKRWGYERFGLMFHLYICIELCLKPRYGPRLARKTEKVEYALARFLKPDQQPEDSIETVRKIRKEMNRRLKVLFRVPN